MKLQFTLIVTLLLIPPRTLIWSLMMNSLLLTLVLSPSLLFSFSAIAFLLTSHGPLLSIILDKNFFIALLAVFILLISWSFLFSLLQFNPSPKTILRTAPTLSLSSTNSPWAYPLISSPLFSHKPCPNLDLKPYISSLCLHFLSQTMLMIFWSPFRTFSYISLPVFPSRWPLLFSSHPPHLPNYLFSLSFSALPVIVLSLMRRELVHQKANDLSFFAFVVFCLKPLGALLHQAHNT